MFFIQWPMLQFRWSTRLVMSPLLEAEAWIQDPPVTMIIEENPLRTDYYHTWPIGTSCVYVISSFEVMTARRKVSCRLSYWFNCANFNTGWYVTRLRLTFFRFYTLQVGQTILSKNAFPVHTTPPPFNAPYRWRVDCFMHHTCHKNEQVPSGSRRSKRKTMQQREKTETLCRIHHIAFFVFIFCGLSNN